MNQERNRILGLLAGGKITADEAGRLLDALEEHASPTAAARSAAATAGPTEGTDVTTKPGAPAKYMYVKAVSETSDNVNVKIPLGLLRAGLKLTSLIPQPALDQINKSMADRGMSLDLVNFKASDLEELIESLREMEIHVDNAANGDNVRVYCA